MSGSRRYTNRGNGRPQQRERITLYPPPRQVPATYTTQNIFNISQSFMAANRYDELLRLIEELKLVRRAIMCVKRKVPTQEIDTVLVNSIMNSVTTEPLPSFMMASQRCPTDNRMFNSEDWTLIYYGMLPNDHQISFTVDSFNAFVEIYSNIMLAVNGINRERIIKSNEVLASKEIRRLDSDDPNYEKNKAAITRKYNLISQNEYEKYKDENVWKYVDSYRDYFKTHDPSDLSDPMTCRIWSMITLDPTICGIDDYVADVIVDKKILYIRYADEYDTPIYWRLINALKEKFFNEFPDYTDESCTEEMFEKWKVVNKYREILLRLILFKMSKRAHENMIEFIHNMRTILETDEVEYVPYSKSTSAAYHKINLESSRGTWKIRSILNKLNDSNFECMSSMLMNMFAPEDVIPLCIESGRVSLDVDSYFVKTLSKVASGHTELVTSTIESVDPKDTDTIEPYWIFYASLVYRGLIREHETIDAILTHALESCTNGEMAGYCLSAFAKCHTITVEKFRKIRERMIQLCNEFIGSHRGMIKFKVMDALELVEQTQG